MLRQILFGAFVSLINIGFHALVMTSVIRTAQYASERIKSRSSVLLITVMIPTISVFMIAHTCEVMIWALSYSFVAVAPTTNFVYFAFVNYTTLGYGDVIPVERWALLGPMTAMNGVLLFGWSTAVIFEIVRKTMQLLEPRKRRS